MQYEDIKVFFLVLFLLLAAWMFCVWIASELISLEPWCERNPHQPKMVMNRRWQQSEVWVFFYI
jgi:hypothetical protein